MGSVNVSVVVPVWNSVDYLRSCVESILNQDYQDFEVILVDDGSTDGSSSLCDTLSSEDTRIRVLHQENCGAGAARKNGVAMSKGQWVMFVDSDDTVTRYGLTFLMKMAASYDIISGGINIKGRLFAHQKDGEYNPVEYIEALLLTKTTDGPVGRLIRRSMFLDMEWATPKEIIQNEDMLMLVCLAKQAKAIYLISDIVCYNYHLRKGTASSAKMGEENWIKLFTLIEEVLRPVIEEYLGVRRAFLVYRIRRLYYNVLKEGSLVRNTYYINGLLSQCVDMVPDEESAKMMKILASIHRQRTVLFKDAVFHRLSLVEKKAKQVISRPLKS